jgi:hypothetical protein
LGGEHPLLKCELYPMVTTQPKQEYLPPVKSNGDTTTKEPNYGVIRDITMYLITDPCSHRAYPEIKLVIKTSQKPFLKVLDPTTAQRLRRKFGEKFSEWYGQEVLICERVDVWGHKYLSIYPANHA